ncbi:MAG: sugar-binding protein, partial [Gemmatimonadaceae bacterium]
MISSAMLGIALALQVGQGSATRTARSERSERPFRVPMPTDSSAVAVRTDKPPIIDGRDDDPVWREAPPITAFRQWQPTEGKEPRFRTEAKVAYDAANLFVFVRAFDPHPDSIIRLLERRDTFTPSD